MWPILLLGGFLALLFTTRRVTEKTATAKTKTGHVWVEGDDTKHLRALKTLVSSGESPPSWLINGAMREAYDRGDWGTVAMLSGATGKREAATPEVVKEDIQIVIGKNSPIEGVSNDEWNAFVGRLKTQQPTFKNERHVGAFHHNRERLGELGIDPDGLADESAQYQALEKDISHYNGAEQSLIRDFCGDVVTIKGAPHGITLSGVLGLLKAAGAKNARSWLRNETERNEFPKTTEMFLQTNGLF